MGAFVQIVEYQTSRYDEVKAMADQYRESIAGKGGPRHVTMTSDRDRPGTFVTVAHFDSYDAAMANSNAPETQQFAEQMQKLCDGPATFRNLDVEKTFDIS